MLSIDVVINAYNYESFIASAIDSVLAQTLSPNSIIIVDDGSTDNTAAILQQYRDKYPDFVKVVRKENGGQLSAVNAAAPYVKSNIVCFLDADDWWEPDYLATVEKTFATDFYIDVVCCSYNKRNGAQTEIYDVGADPGVIVLRAAFLHKWYFVPTSGVSFRSSSYKSLIDHRFENLFRMEADAFFLHKAAAAGMCFRNIRQPLYNYRDHGNNIWLNKVASAERRVKRMIAVEQVVADAKQNLLRLSPEMKLKILRRELESSIRRKDFSFGEFISIASELRIPLYKRFRLCFGRYLKAYLQVRKND